MFSFDLAFFLPQSLRISLGAGGLGQYAFFFPRLCLLRFLWFEPRSLAVVSLSHESTVHGVFFQWTFVWSQKEESSTFQGVMPGWLFLCFLVFLRLQHNGDWHMFAGLAWWIRSVRQSTGEGSTAKELKRSGRRISAAAPCSSMWCGWLCVRVSVRFSMWCGMWCVIVLAYGCVLWHVLCGSSCVIFHVMWQVVCESSSWVFNVMWHVLCVGSCWVFNVMWHVVCESSCLLFNVMWHVVCGSLRMFCLLSAGTYLEYWIGVR